MKKILHLPAKHYLDLLHNNKPFSFARYGDGEAICMYNPKKRIKNCDGSHYTNELSSEFKKIFKNQHPYYHCLLNCSFWGIEGKWFKEFINEVCPNTQFYNGEIWQKLSFNGEIEKIINVFNSYKTCIIGPSHIKNLVHIKGLSTQLAFIETPAKNSFNEYQKIYNSIIHMYSNGYRLFSFSTGYTSKILIDNLFPVIGHDSFLIDFGSIFDPYCGKLSRSGMRKSGFEKFQPFTKYKLIN